MENLNIVLSQEISKTEYKVFVDFYSNSKKTIDFIFKTHKLRVFERVCLRFFDSQKKFLNPIFMKMGSPNPKYTITKNAKISNKESFRYVVVGKIEHFDEEGITVDFGSVKYKFDMETLYSVKVFYKQKESNSLDLSVTADLFF